VEPPVQDEAVAGQQAHAFELVAELEGIEDGGLAGTSTGHPSFQLRVVIGVASNALEAESRDISQQGHHTRRIAHVGDELLGRRAAGSDLLEVTQAVLDRVLDTQGGLERVGGHPDYAARKGARSTKEIRLLHDQRLSAEVVGAQGRGHPRSPRADHQEINAVIPVSSIPPCEQESGEACMENATPSGSTRTYDQTLSRG